MNKKRIRLFVLSGIFLSIAVVLGTFYFFLYGVSLMKSFDEGKDIFTILRTNPNFLCAVITLSMLLILSIIILIAAIVPGKKKEVIIKEQ